MPSTARRLPFVLALVLVALLAAGCGLGEGERRAGGGAELLVTRGFGQQLVASSTVPDVRDGLTVMRLLASRHRVETRYGGGFVQSIDGLEGEGPDGGRDWLYYVNGLESEVGAAQRTVAPNDVVQWDFRRWDRVMHVRGIVGAFPEPFVHGVQGERLPVRLECQDAESVACREVRGRLTAFGVRVSLAPLGAGGGAESLRVIVAPWSALRELRAGRPLGRGPEQSGVFARFSLDGRALELLDEGGRPVRRAPAGAGLVGVVGVEGERPAWLVTGLDATGVDRAARALDRRVLRHRFAVAVGPGLGSDGVAALPLRSARQQRRSGRSREPVGATR